MNSFLSSIQDNAAYIKVMEMLPDAGRAILILGVGLLVAAALYFITIRILEFFAIDKLAGKTPITTMLRRAGIHRSISEILALLVFWLTVFFALKLIDIPQISQVVDTVTDFIPRLIAALLIVIFGMLLAKFLRALVEQPLSTAQIKYAAFVGKTVYVVVLIFVFLFAFDQLSVFDLSFITTNVMIVLAGLLVVVGVGSVIASRTLLENVFACSQLRQMISAGDRVTVGSVSGTVDSFTMTSVVLRDGSTKRVLPALLFFTQTYSIEQPNG